MSEPRHQNKELLDHFYLAMKRRNGEEMSACYHAEAQFEDPVFGELDSQQVRNMWKMLMSRTGNDFEVHCEIMRCDEDKAEVRMEARYNFGPAKRKVVNRINSQFLFKDDKIFRQKDHFSFWRWSSMALGGVGKALGWSAWLRGKVRRSSLRLLDRYIQVEGQ